ncbi:hypothetical protein Ade02nite_24250 [Paractinoplanes deccanensis]|uniref:DUF6311 domain-containing protein n=1 Tax=Paractinoplanes deccanensis TaxID=113561 RepID=A0ABQ3Y1C0_9ACTN|nr:hypothetical protein [Actinoplanes deccanensis]GID73784.1 hypothetical protein Ade02nite_24250 [Actinoplanes deccanensis]
MSTIADPPRSTVEERPPAQTAQTPRGSTLRRVGGHVLALAGYLSLSIYVMSRLLADPSNRLLAANMPDHHLFVFFMAHAERVVFDGASPLWSDRLNAPDGVNMMANTSMLAAGIPLSPITHWFGPGVSAAVLAVAGFAGTAAAWYWLLNRLGLSRTAAWIGGLWAAFAPGFISQAGGHLNFISSYVLPFIVWQVIRLREPGRAVRGGVTLAVLVVIQIFLNEELLLFTAMVLGLITVVYVVARPALVREEGRRFVTGLLVAAAVAGAAVAYPLWFQFAGPGHYRGQPFEIDQYATSLGAIVAYPGLSIAGDQSLARQLSGSITEANTFWGAGACVMIIVSVVLLRRSLIARAIAVAALVMLVLSLGRHFRLTAEPGTVPAPLGWVRHLPLFDTVTVPRYALPATVLVGLLLAFGVDRARSLRVRGGRVAFAGGMAAALVPLFPLPLPTITAAPLPPFFTERMYRPYVTDGGSVLTVPLPDHFNQGIDGMRVVSMSGLEFRAPRGYFMGPHNPPEDITGAWEPPRRYTSDLLVRVNDRGKGPKLTPAEIQSVRDDLRYWETSLVVVLPYSWSRSAVRDTLTEVLGPPRQAGECFFWDVRYLKS